MIHQILSFVRSQLASATKYSSRSDYTRGFVDANEEIEEYILDLLWERGDYDDEDSDRP